MIMVSICCVAYNQEQYIRQTLDSFLAQKTNFSYEIIISDDASTDHTADIIRQYEQKYPEIIKPVYYTKNIYSQGINPDKLNYAKAVGKYIAFCEGDDYWIDDYKLQKQVDYMESHPDCTFCFTNAYFLAGETYWKKFMPVDPRSYKLKDNQVDIDAGELALLGTTPTASYMWPTEKVVFPPLPKGTFDHDLYLSIYAASKGYAHFLDEYTCIYRTDNPNSLMHTWQADINKFLAVQESIRKLYLELKDMTGHRFDNVFDFMIFINKVDSFMASKNCKELRNLVKTGEIKILDEPGLWFEEAKNDYRNYCYHPEFSIMKRDLEVNGAKFLHKLIDNKPILNRLYKKIRGRE